MTQCKAAKRGGFSLVELVVVLAIAGILLGLMLPAIYAAQGAAGSRKDMNNLKQLALACHSVNDVFRKLPPAFDKFGQIQFPASVHVHLMPYVELDNTYKTYLKEEGKGEPANVKISIPFVSEDDPSAAKQDQKGIQNFPANLRVFSNKGVALGEKFETNIETLAAVEPGTAAIPRTFLDGTSNTIGFATKYGYCGKDGGSRYASAANTASAAFFGQNAAKVKAHASDKTATFQLQPSAKDCLTTPLMAQSFTKKGILVGLFDGSVRSVSPDLTPRTWNAAMQPNDGQVLGNDWDN